MNPFAKAFQDVDQAVAELDYVVHGDTYKRGYEALQQMKARGNELEHAISNSSEHLEALKTARDEEERKIRNRKLVQALDRPPRLIQADDWLQLLSIFQQWVEPRNLPVKPPTAFTLSTHPYWLKLRVVTLSLSELTQWIIKGVGESKAHEPKIAYPVVKPQPEADEEDQAE